MIVGGIVVMCCACPNNAKREATVFVKCGGGGLYFCSGHGARS